MNYKTPQGKRNKGVLLLVGDPEKNLFETISGLAHDLLVVKKIRMKAVDIRQSIVAYTPDIITFVHDGLDNTAFIETLDLFKSLAYKSIIISTSHFKEIEEIVCQSGYSEYWFSPIGKDVLKKRIETISQFSRKVAEFGEGSANQTTERSRLLIVEDNQYDRILLEETLKKEYDLVVTDSAQEALSTLSTSCESGKEINGIILDVFLPGDSGFKVFETIRADEAHAEIPIIFSTSKTSWRDVMHGLNLGAADYLKKPIQPFRVLAKVNAALFRAGMEQAWRKEGRDT
ncbi:MAG: response regulator [Pseudomonadales bacterium]|nr:response regulator [Pseudomonadales bacterium]